MNNHSSCAASVLQQMPEARKRGIRSTVVIYGITASAAAIMALAADRVVMTEICSMMLHGVYHMTWDGKIITKGDDIDRANAVCLSLIQRRCPSYTMDMLLAKDNWYSAAEAKELGLIDEIRPLDDFAKDTELKNMFSGLLNMATHASKPNGGNKMSKTAKNDLDEKDVETQIEEQKKKVEELENDEGDAPADESDPGQLIYKGSILTISKDSEIIVFLAVMDTRCPTRNCLSDSRTGLLKNTMSSCSESDVVRYKSITKLSTRLVLLVSKKVTFLIVPSTLKKESCMLSS